MVCVVFKHTLSSYPSTRPKQERIETNGDGVKPGSPPKVFSVGLSPVPVCFGVLRELMQQPLGGCGGLKREIECTSRVECCSPSFPSGIPPPLGKSSVLLKCGICFSSLLIKFESRIEIIKRRTVLTKRRSLCPTENTFGGDPDGERKATRRALRPCLLNVSSGLRGRGARRGVQAAATPPVNA